MACAWRLTESTPTLRSGCSGHHLWLNWGEVAPRLALSGLRHAIVILFVFIRGGDP